MSVGQVLDEAWTIYTKFFVKFFVVALIVLGSINLGLGLLGERSTAARTATRHSSPWSASSRLVVGLLWLEGAFVRGVQTARSGTFDHPDRRALP